MSFGTLYQGRTQVFPGEGARIQRGFRLATGGLLSPDLPAKGPPDQGTFRPAEEFLVRRGPPYNGGLVLGGPPVQRVSCTERASCTEKAFCTESASHPERASCPGDLLFRGAAWPDGPPVKMGLMSIWASVQRGSPFSESASYPGSSCLGSLLSRGASCPEKASFKGLLPG